MKEGRDVAVITLGPIGVQAAAAIEEAETLHDSLTIAHYDLRFVKPLDEALLHQVGKQFRQIVTVEDGARMGGMGSAVMEWLEDHGYRVEVTRIGLPDEFVEHGTVEELQRIVGLDKESLVKAFCKASGK